MNKKYEVAVNLQQDYTAAEQTQGRNNIGACDIANIAPAYTNEVYAANSYVVHDGVLYTNENVISTAEDWNPTHWTQTTVAEMMARMGEVVAAALDDLDARVRCNEEAISATNLGERIADRLDVQTLLVGGEDVTDRLNNM